MYQDAFEAVCNAAKAKTDLFKKNPLGYFVSAMVAGMFIAFGAFISNAAAAPFADAQRVSTREQAPKRLKNASPHFLWIWPMTPE